MVGHMDLSLTENERALLQEVLSSSFRDLRMEVAGTDNFEYRRALQAREATMLAIVERLGGLLELT